MRRARTAVAELISQGSRVTVHGVAVRGGVSRSFIYSTPELLAEIRQHAGNDRRLVVPAVNARASEGSLHARLSDALDRIRELKGENEALRVEREVLLGQNRELRREARSRGRRASADA
jgi:hypothetical protein